MEKINLEIINSMEGHKFEDLIEDLLSKMGYKVEGHKPAADGGIDIVAYNFEPIVEGKYIIQCKRYSTSIPETVIRDLYGVVTDQKANKGVVITTANFTSASVKFAEGKPIELIDGIKLITLLSKYFPVEDYVKERKLTIEQELLLTTAIDEIKRLKDDFTSIKSGTVFRRGKLYNTDKGYADFIAKNGSEITNFTNVLTNLFKILFADFEKKINDSGFDMNKEINALRKKVREGLNEFFDAFRGFYFTEYPNRCRTLHNAMYEVYSSIFGGLFSWADLFSDVIKSPEQYLTNGGNLKISLDYKDKVSIDENVKIITKEIRKIRSGGCFIATACYGSESAEVSILREFKDMFLSNSRIGQVSIWFYYKISPACANIIKNNRFLKKITRFLLNPIVFIVRGCLAKKG